MASQERNDEALKSIVNFVVRNKLAVWLLTIIVTASGIYSGTKMKMETLPDISIPYVMVTTVYPGATPQKVMEDVSIPVEKTVEGLEGVKTVISNSYSNVSSIQVEFEYEKDMDEAKREVQSALESLTLPKTTEKPTISRISLNMFPVMALSVSSDKEDIVELTSTVEDILVPKIEKLNGVASVNIAGQHIEEVDLTYDEAKMASLGITEDDVKKMIQASDMSVSLGLFKFDKAEQAVSVDGKFMTANDLKGMLIPRKPTTNNPMPFVKLSDIAKIEVIGKEESISRTNGKNAISLQIIKSQDANTVTVVNAVKDLMKEEQGKIDGLKANVTLDQGKPIEESISTMVEKAVFGGGIAVLIILLFLRDFKSTIISIVSIPVSIFLAFLLLHWMDITLNIMTLGAVTVAIGRVIDDSIVVVENIFRRLHLKDETLNGRALIREATLEMFKPILSSTLVTVAVFAPLMFVGGMVGELFMPFALTMTFALGASLLVAITIVPALSHTLFKKKLYLPKTESQHKEQGKLAEAYKKVLSWTLNHKVITSILAIVMLAGSLALTPLIGFSFLGSEQEKVMYLTYTPAPGELPEKSLENVTYLEQKMLKRDDIDIVQISVTDKVNAQMAMMGGSNGSLMYLIFDPDTKNFPDVKAKIEDYVKNIGQSGEWKSQNFSSSTASSNELSYTVYSEDLNKLKSTIADIENVMSKSGQLKDVTSTVEKNYDEFTLRVEQDTLLRYGLTTGQIVMLLNPMKQEDVLTTVQKDGSNLDVIVQRNKNLPTSIDDLLSQQVTTGIGTKVKLADIVTLKKGTTSNSLARSAGQYYASVSGTVKTDDVTKASKAISAKVDKLKVPKGVEIKEAGVTADIQETFTQLGIAMMAAIAIVYFILVVTFGEGLAPFAILFSLPFTVIGSFVGLLLAGETISVSVMMGLLMLIGIVVTNAIVLVDRIIHMERDGLAMREAILEAGATRLRPILMTAIATIGALMPLLFGAGGGGLISKGLGVTVIGGLTSSTLLTLVIVPIVYEILSKLFKKNRRDIEDN